MHRRSLLKGMASAAFAPLWLVTPAGATAVSPPPARFRRLRPADAEWPSAADWDALDRRVGGQLLRPQALFSACATAPKGAACADAVSHLTNPFYIGDQVSGTQVSGWLDAWAPAASAYAVAARSTSDVAAAVDFARDRRLRLAVKGAGHSYLGTSCAPDSLLVWTRHMNKVALHDAFIPQSAHAIEPVPAVSAEAGAVWIDLYDAVTSKGGRYVQGGGCADVGVAGLVQSGGFGSFSKGFGTAASHLLEAEIVTADGEVRVVNAFQDPDLYWALKGGGGGSWGVITRLTLRTHDLPAQFGAAWGEIQALNEGAFRKLVAAFFEHYRQRLCNPHWGEQASFAPGNKLNLSFVSQGLSRDQARETWKPFFDFVNAAPREYKVLDELGAGAKPAREWWAVAGNHSMVADDRPGAPPHHGWWKGDQDQVGAFIHGYDSLWLPRALLDRPGPLVGAIVAASRLKKVELHFNKGLAGAPPAALAAARETATNPAVTEAFALALIADGEGPQYPDLPGAHLDREAGRRDARTIAQAAAELRRVAPNSGSYVPESNYFNADWQREYWGTNYPRLRAVKDKYDAGGLFFVHHGVGSEDWSADGFTKTRT